MRIVLAVEVLAIGGLPNYVLALARLLAADGCDVVVAHGNEPLPAHLEYLGLAMMHLPGLDGSAGAAAVEDATARLLAWAPDVVHIHLCSNVGMLERLVASGLPLVRTFHDLTSMCLRRGRRRWPGDRCQRALHWSCAAWGCMVSPPGQGTLWPRFANLPRKLAERDQYRMFHAAIACSGFMARTLATNGFAPNRVHVVPNFTSFEEDATADEAPAKRPGVPGRDRPFELLFSGQAVTGKGLEILVSALAGIEQDWRLTVLSEGPRLAMAQTLARQFGISDRIRFLGWIRQAETRQHYLDADLLVIPSIIDEVLPLVGIEAMSLGTALVGFAVGGISDYLHDGETGILVNDVSEAGLRAGLRRALADPDTVRAWAQAGRRHVANNYARKTHLQALYGVYRAAAYNGGSRPVAEHSAELGVV